MPYYLAVKIQDDKKEEFLLLTASPCMTPWNDTITTISFADPRLVKKMQVIGSYSLPIYACSSPSQIMYAISIWLESATWNEIILITPHLVKDPKTMTAIVPILKSMLMAGFGAKIKPDPTFSVDQMYFAYITRRWAVNAQSSPGWKKLFVSNIDDTSNALIRIAKQIVVQCGVPDGDHYSKIYQDTADTATERSLHDNSFEKYLTALSKKSLKPHLEQFLCWVNANFASMKEATASRIFNMCVTIISKQDMPRTTPTIRQRIVIPEYIPLGRMDVSSTVTNLTFLMEIKQDALFVEYICGLLTCERYVFLLQIPHVMQYLTKCMRDRPIYTSLIAYAMSFAMFYTTQLEFAAGSRASESAPFVFMHDMVCEFPRFGDPTPYVPVSVKYIDSHVPFHIAGARIPVCVVDIPARLNAAMVKQTSRFDIIKDIPWTTMKLILTGSRYASACWIGPREREIYGGDYGKYIAEYFGSSEPELAALLELVDSAGPALQDILGRDFLADPLDQTDQDTTTTENKSISAEEKKVADSSADVQQAIVDLAPWVDSITNLTNALGAYAINAACTSVGATCVGTTGGSGAEVKVAMSASPRVAETKDVETKTAEAKEIPVNEPAREIFMTMKYAKEMFANHTDIDIGFVGSESEFDAAAAAFVTYLRKFGKAVGLRFQKARSYTWVIVTDFLRYTIDFFHARESALGLIVNFMTSYPRAWYNGISHMCTADYVCARMTGINNRYIFTMNDPIYTMMKAARREDISILLNYNEEGMLRRWLEVNMPGVKLILGNVDMTHTFFRPFKKVNENEMAGNNDRKPWLTDPMMMPKSRVALTPWTTENAEPLVKPHGILEPISGKKIKVADPTIFSRYMAEIDEIASENIVRDIRWNTTF